jgi:hypothetical protein
LLGGICCFVVVMGTWLVVATLAKFPLKAKASVTLMLLLPFVCAGLFTGKFLFLDEPLVTACYDGDVTTIRRLLDAGANPNAQTEFGSPICAALDNKHSDAVKILVNKGADPNTQCEALPLDIAANRGDWDLAKFLKSKGAKRRGSP